LSPLSCAGEGGYMGEGLTPFRVNLQDEPLSGTPFQDFRWFGGQDLCSFVLFN